MCNFYLDYFEAKCNKIDDNVMRFPVLIKDPDQSFQPHYVSIDDSLTHYFEIVFENGFTENVQPMRNPIDDMNWPR